MLRNSYWRADMPDRLELPDLTNRRNLDPVELQGNTFEISNFNRRARTAAGIKRTISAIYMQSVAGSLSIKMIEQFIDNLAARYQDQLIEHIPPMAEGLLEYREKLESEIVQLFSSDSFRKAVFVSFAALLPSFKDNSVSTPYHKMNEVFAMLPESFFQQPGFGQFMLEVIHDLQKSDGIYGRHLEYQNFINEKMANYLIYHGLEVNQANTFTAIKDRFPTRQQLEIHCQLLESAAIAASKEAVEALSDRLRNLAEHLLPESGIGSIVAESFKKFATEAVLKLYDLRKSNNQAFGIAVFGYN